MPRRPTTPVKVLTALIILLDKSSKWTKCTYARSKTNEDVRYDARSACQWCLTGGLCRICGRANYQVYSNAEFFLDKASNENFAARGISNREGTVQFNDHGLTTFTQIKSVMRAALKLAKAATKKEAHHAKAHAKA